VTNVDEIDILQGAVRSRVQPWDAFCQVTVIADDADPECARAWCCSPSDGAMGLVKLLERGADFGVGGVGGQEG